MCPLGSCSKHPCECHKILGRSWQEKNTAGRSRHFREVPILPVASPRILCGLQIKTCVCQTSSNLRGNINHQSLYDIYRERDKHGQRCIYLYNMFLHYRCSHIHIFVIYRFRSREVRQFHCGTPLNRLIAGEQLQPGDGRVRVAAIPWYYRDGLSKIFRHLFVFLVLNQTTNQIVSRTIQISLWN